MDDEYTKVISFEREKVWISKINDIRCFAKRTNVNETENLKIAKGLLRGKFIEVGEKKYLMDSPNVLKYEEESNIAFLEECAGRNLELMLRNEESRAKAVKLLNAIMIFCIKTSFRWKDFAPRNILISDDKIHIVDFERGFEHENNISLYLRENVYEEYCAFLLPQERIISEGIVFDDTECKNKVIEIKDIKSKRVKTIAQLLEMNSYITYTKYTQIVKNIINAETPYMTEDKKISFPIIELEQILKEYGYEKYAHRILDINNIKTKINIQCLCNEYKDKNTTKLSSSFLDSSKFIKSNNINVFSN